MVNFLSQPIHLATLALGVRAWRGSTLSRNSLGGAASASCFLRAALAASVAMAAAAVSAPARPGSGVEPALAGGGDGVGATALAARVLICCRW